MRPKTDKQETSGKGCSVFQSHSAIRFAVESTAAVPAGDIDEQHRDQKVTKIGRDVVDRPARVQGVEVGDAINAQHHGRVSDEQLVAVLARGSTIHGNGPCRCSRRA
jgi:hypothetical protein